MGCGIIERFWNRQISVVPSRGAASTRAGSNRRPLMAQLIPSIPSLKSLVAEAAVSDKRSRGRKSGGTAEVSASRRVTPKSMICPVRPTSSLFCGRTCDPTGTWEKSTTTSTRSKGDRGMLGRGTVAAGTRRQWRSG